MKTKWNWKVVVAAIVAGVCVLSGTVTAANENLKTIEKNGFVLTEDGKTLLEVRDTTRTSYSIPKGVTTIGKRAFCRVSENLTSITIPKGVTTIGEKAFYACRNLTRVTISASVTTIEAGAFSKCEKLTGVTIPKGVTTIGYGAFYECENLTRITLPASLTSIGAHAFSSCSNLTRITIPASVTSIGRGAFDGSGGMWGRGPGLTVTVSEKTYKQVGVEAFEGVKKLKITK